MRTDTIDAVGIDSSGSLWVKPANATFPYIYREAMAVQWNAEQGCLFTPKPREWTYVDGGVKARESGDLVVVVQT